MRSRCRMFIGPNAHNKPGYHEGMGEHPSGQWPGEPSFLILGLPLDAAKQLGARHEQNAIVWCGTDAVPQLILLR